MLSTQQVLQSLIDMQANAQQALPVIPNNGNPRGANNMPRTGGALPPRQGPSTGGVMLPQQQPAGGGYDSSGIIPPHMRQQSPMAERYPWLKQSASMDNIRNYLNNRRGIFQQRRQQPATQPPTFTGVAQVEPVERPISLPVIPMRAAEM